MLLLCLITQVSIAMVHLEHVRSRLAAQAVFTVGAIIALGMIAIQETPFGGPMRIPPTSLEQVLKAITT